MDWYKLKKFNAKKKDYIQVEINRLISTGITIPGSIGVYKEIEMVARKAGDKLEREMLQMEIGE